MDAWAEHIVRDQVFLDGTKIREVFFLNAKFNLDCVLSLLLISCPCSSVTVYHQPRQKPAIKLITGWHPRARKKDGWNCRPSLIHIF
jgi:hypothetical protein